MVTATRRKFTAYRTDTLCSVEIFKYLGRAIARDNCDKSAIRGNLKRARQVWGQIFKIIAKKEVAPKFARMFYHAVAAAVLLYGSKTWCIMETAHRPFDGFRIEKVQHIRGKIHYNVKRGGETVGVPPHRWHVCGDRTPYPPLLHRQCNHPQIHSEPTLPCGVHGGGAPGGHLWLP